MEPIETILLGILVAAIGAIQAWMVHGFRTEVREEIQALRAEVREEIRALRSDLTQVALAVGARRPAENA